MNILPDDLPSEIPADTQERSPFQIRLNTTYNALLFTREGIDVSIAIELTSRLDEIIYDNQDKKDVNVTFYEPASPAYTVSKVRSYFLARSRKPQNLWEALQPDYGLTKHHLKIEHQGESLQWLKDALAKTPLTSNEWKDLMSSASTESGFVIHPEEEDSRSADLLPKDELSDFAFDLLNYDSQYELRYDGYDSESKNDFHFFFAIRLGTEDLSVIDDFVAFHLNYNFSGDATKFSRFLKIICTEYRNSIITPDRINLIESWKPAIESSKAEELTSLSEVKSVDKKAGRPKKENIQIPFPPQRIVGDNKTRLTVEETVYLFKILQETDVLLKKNSDLNETSLSNAIYAITGYAFDSLYKSIGKFKMSKYSENTKRKVREKLSEIIMLINRDL